MDEVKHFASLLLPYPPSINHYYGKKGHRIFLTAKGKAFREGVEKAVSEQFKGKTSSSMLSMFVMYFPPDRRKRDLDNPRKALQDALMKTGIFEDDSQIFIAREMKSPVPSKIKGGYCYVILDEINESNLDMLVLVDMQLKETLDAGGELTCPL